MVTSPVAVEDLADWLTGGGRPLGGPRTIVNAMCERLVAAGVPVDRMGLFIRTLHPNSLGRRLTWIRGAGVKVEDLPHSRMAEGYFRRSVAVAIIEGSPGIRARLRDLVPPYDYETFEELKSEGFTDYLIYPLIYTNGDTHAASFCTQAPDGFSEADIAALMRIQAPLARVSEAYVLRLNAAHLLSAYVGRNAGRRVLDGQIQKGDVEQLDAVILFCDLKNFTAWSDSVSPGEVIAGLNVYFEHMVSAIMSEDGEVLKFLGDGLLAIFSPAVRGEAVALQAAARSMFKARDALQAGGFPQEFRAAIHAGKVSYGNVGGGNRLDFTAIGPAVNLAARLLGVASSTGEDFVCSARAAAALSCTRSLGWFALKGMPTAQEVFALVDGADTP